MYFLRRLTLQETNLITARVSILSKSRASLTCFRACFLPGRAKDLSAPRYYRTHWILTRWTQNQFTASTPYSVMPILILCMSITGLQDISYFTFDDDVLSSPYESSTPSHWIHLGFITIKTVDAAA